MTPRLRLHALGTGPTTVVLHGFAGSSRAMAPLTERLDGRVVAVDLIGHGRSPAPRSVEPYRAAAQVEQLDRVIAELAPVRLLGYSMGARLALTYAVAHPERLRELVLVSGRASVADRAGRVAQDEAIADRVERDGVRAFIEWWAQRPIFATQSPGLVTAQRADRLAQPAVGLANSLRGFGAGAMPPLDDALPGLATPTHLVCGARDPKFVAAAATMRAALPNARSTTLDVGHAVHLEAPQALATLLNEGPDA